MLSADSRWALLVLLLLSGCGGSDSGTPGSLTAEPAVSSEPALGQAGDQPMATPAMATSETATPPTSVATMSDLLPEKTALKFGFIKLTDCAPLVIAKEKGFFADEGLQAEVIAQPNWKTLLDNVISGELDGAHMLSGQPIAATIGIGTRAPIVTAMGCPDSM